LVTGELLQTKDVATAVEALSTHSPEAVSEKKKIYELQLVQIFIITARTIIIYNNHRSAEVMQNKYVMYCNSI